MGKKGKAPKGRAAAKKKAQKGTSNGPSTPKFASGSRLSRQVLEDDEDDDTFPRFRGFAQNPQRNAIPLNSAQKFRHQAISFVSASSNTPAQQEVEQSQPSEEAIFVAAENSDDEDKEEEDLDDDALQTNLVSETDVEIQEHAVAHMSIESTQDTAAVMKGGRSSVVFGRNEDVDQQRYSSNTPDATLFVVDTMGDPSLSKSEKSTGKKPMNREPSVAESASSEEEVVFRGRKKPKVDNEPVQLQVGKSAASDPHATQRALTNVFQPKPNGWSNDANFNPARATGWAAKQSKQDAEVNLNARWAPAPAGSWWKKGKPRPDLDPSLAEKKAIDSAPKSDTKVMFVDPLPQSSTVGSKNANHESAAEETIRSLQADWKAVLQTKNSAKQTSKSPKDRRSKRARKKDNRTLRAPIESEDEDDDEAAYDDYMANLAAQLDGDDAVVNGLNGFASVKVDGPSLVVNGKEIADDEVLNASHMNEDDDTSSESTGPIGQDLSDVSSGDDGGNLSDLDSSQLEETLEYTEQEQWEDEEDLRERRYDMKTDEQLARLLAKQEELGIHEDEIMIDDGEYVTESDDPDGVGDIDEAWAGLAGLADMSNFTSGHTPKKHGLWRSTNRRKDNFPDASALADSVDQYGQNGFDIMDFDRPSLRPKKKGRKGRLPEELEALSDDELKETMAESWDNDRAKKRLKKAEREDLRRQGLLGAAGRKGKADLSEKYQFGVTRQQIFDELRAFMQNDGHNSLPFPPMEKGERKALHDICNVMNLKSKSVGMGKNRFPVVYKTRLSVYDSTMFDNTMALSSKGLLDRDAKFGKKIARKKMKKGDKLTRGQSGGGVDAATIRNGEIVGAGADEISKESFGHKMMLKMGWSKGMALGREGEGILKPVEQVMRAGRAGLG